MFKALALLAAVLLVSSCSITQNVEPAQIAAGGELCIIENSAVREGFIVEFTAELTRKGIAHRMVGQNPVPPDCLWTATYTARWSWDLSLYMSYAEIKVFSQGKLEGQAIYDATKGSASLNKFIDAEPKIRELVDQLMQYQSAGLFMRQSRFSV
jgi:hypothetical protein